MRSLAVILFIGLVAAVAIYCAQRPTIARGDVIAADLIQSNPTLETLDCQREVPIGISGATFECKAKLKNGDQVDLTWNMDRAGMISVVDRGETRSAPRIKKTSDPWGD